MKCKSRNSQRTLRNKVGGTASEARNIMSLQGDFGSCYNDEFEQQYSWLGIHYFIPL